MLADRSRRQETTRAASRTGARARLIGSLWLVAAGLSSCAYVEQARLMTDTSTVAAQQAALDALVEANTERQRLRRLRCLDPLLTPMTIKRAAADSRLGQPWLEELLRDCPELTAVTTH